MPLPAVQATLGVETSEADLLESQGGSSQEEIPVNSMGSSRWNSLPQSWCRDELRSGIPTRVIGQGCRGQAPRRKNHRGSNSSLAPPSRNKIMG